MILYLYQVQYLPILLLLWNEQLSLYGICYQSDFFGGQQPHPLTILEDFLDLDLVERMYQSEKIDAFQLASNDKEKKVVLELEHGRRGFDELLDISGLSAAQLTSFLTRLEMEGAVRETPGNTYMLTNL